MLLAYFYLKNKYACYLPAKQPKTKHRIDLSIFLTNKMAYNFTTQEINQ
jgi:hypothetical protein